ncbi:hypothetical protein D3C83_194080 [compost metagenome]
MQPVKTASASAIRSLSSSSGSRSTLRSISSNCQLSGMKAANVMSPSGGKAAFLPIMGMMWR